MSALVNHRLQTAFVFLCIFLACTLLLSGCGVGGGSDIINDFDDFFKDPDTEPVKATIRTTVPLAYAASVAMANNSCSSYPCFDTIFIDASTLPAPFASSGHITVVGLWNSPDDAILTVLFVDMFAGSSLFQVHNVSTFPVTRDPLTGVITVVYANINVNVATPVDPQTLTPGEILDIQALFTDITIRVSPEPAVNLGMDAWVVDVDDAGTPNNFSDDTYTINGGQEDIGVGSGSASIFQMGLADVVMAPAQCSLNPVDGLAVLNELNASSSSLPVVATALLTFDSTCDGRAKVSLATGNYALSNGKSIPLHLNVP